MAFRDFDGQGNRFVFVLQEAWRVRAERRPEVVAQERESIRRAAVAKMKKDAGEFDSQVEGP